jgi:murein DD-endopeptidase MepM/ murein hydrolase activator NlpD
MKRRLLILGLILAGCSPMPGTLFVQPSPTSWPSTTVTALPPFKENTPVPLPSPSEAQMPEVLPSLIPSLTTTAFPTMTQITWTYIFPIEPSNIADFSEGTAGHGYPATDIFAPEGSKFVAVTDGVVDFVSTEDRWNPDEDDPAVRGGLCVAIIGEDGVRYYGSHLSAVEQGINPGVRVTAGQLLGHVGHTGDARNTPSHLHFGISRPTLPEDWHARRGEVDPFPFLVAWRDGHNVTPPLPTP